LIEVILAKIYQHNNTKNSLSNEYSSKYAPTEIDSPILKNGSSHNPASSYVNTEKLNKEKSDFSYDFDKFSF
jgi:hypothetical protein